jgi:hypothetical protein
LLAVVIGEGHALVPDAVDVGRLVADQSTGDVADVADSDVVTPDDEDVGLLGRGFLGESRGDEKDGR